MTTLIAEFCQNHLGKRDILRNMLLAAAKTGYTHAKIQGLYSEEITKREEFEYPGAPIYRPYSAEVERLKKLDLSEDDESWFVSEAKSLGLTPMITVFTHAGSERAFDAGFQSIKFASYDCASYPLIERVAKYAKEIIVSTGATPWRDVTKTASKLRALSDDGIIVGILHARTVYPATPKDAGLARMLALNSFGLPTGFSDHSMPMQDGVLATKFALFLGANIIERHFTILPRDETKDGPVSVNEQDSISINTFSKLNKADQLLNLGADFSKIGTYLSIESLEPTEQEFVNAKYYRGRVASMIGNHRIYGWESIDSAD